MKDFKIIKTNEDWELAIKEGYTALIGGINHNEVKDGYVACNWDNYKDVFKHLTGFDYIEEDGAHGTVRPIEDTLGGDNLF